MNTVDQGLNSRGRGQFDYASSVLTNQALLKQIITNTLFQENYHIQGCSRAGRLRQALEPYKHGTQMDLRFSAPTHYGKLDILCILL